MNSRLHSAERRLFDVRDLEIRQPFNFSQNERRLLFDRQRFERTIEVVPELNPLRFTVTFRWLGPRNSLPIDLWSLCLQVIDATIAGDDEQPCEEQCFLCVVGLQMIKCRKKNLLSHIFRVVVVTQQAPCEAVNGLLKPIHQLPKLVGLPRQHGIYDLVFACQESALG